MNGLRAFARWLFAGFVVPAGLVLLVLPLALLQKEYGAWAWLWVVGPPAAYFLYDQLR